MKRRLRAHAYWVLGVVCFCSSANAQQQPLCIPGTNLCINGNGQGGVSGGAHGQVGPNGASGGANGNANGNASGGGRVTPPPPPQYPSPQYPPPQPQPTPLPAPTPAPTPQAPPASAPIDYGPRQPQDVFPGIGVYPVMRVGTQSGFHFGGDIGFGFHGPRWGFELETMFLYGGTVKMADISFVPSLILPFNADDDPAIYTGFYARLGPEFRFSFAGNNDISRGQIFALGVQAGVGYEIAVSQDISIRILDVRAVAAWRGADVPPPNDNFGHDHEYGMLFASGLTFF